MSHDFDLGAKVRVVRVIGELLIAVGRWDVHQIRREIKDLCNVLGSLEHEHENSAVPLRSPPLTCPRCGVPAGSERATASCGYYHVGTCPMRPRAGLRVTYMIAPIAERPSAASVYCRLDAPRAGLCDVGTLRGTFSLSRHEMDRMRAAAPGLEFVEETPGVHPGETTAG